MSFFNDTFCQVCESFINEEQRDKYLHSSRHLHREMNGYKPADFPQRKLFENESIILDKGFWTMFLCN